MRIALLVVLAFAGLWFAALRPKVPTEAPIEPIPAAQPAKAKVAEAAAAQPKAAAAKPKPAAAKPKAAVTKPAPAVAKPAPVTGVERVVSDVRAGHTTVLLFWDRSSSDDREVRRAVAGIDRRGGKVKVHVAPISRVGAYEQITGGAPVVTSPTVLVLDGKGRTRSIGGLTVTRELDELVGKALAGR